MYYVYVLVNPSKSKTYIGYTSNLKRRLNEHQQGKPYWTKRLEQPTLYYYEAYSTEAEAKNRESKLKQRGSAKQALFKRIGL